MRIAIIDDNSTVGASVEVVLRKNGSVMPWDTFERFYDIESFVVACQASDIDSYGVIICDHDLGLNQPKGYDIATFVRNNGYMGKIILFTSDDSISMGLKIGETAGIDYVVKNFSSKENNAYDLLSTLIGSARN